MATTIRLEVDDAVAVATLARPEKLNALSRSVVAELTAVVERLAADPAVRVLVLQGQGRMFSAGADVDEFRHAFGADAVDPDLTEADAREGTRLTDALAAPELVTIAAVHGAAIGGAAAVVAACDLRIMAKGSKIVVPELVMGFPLAWGAVPRLVEQLGASVVRDLLLTCRPLGSDEALARGFAARVVPADELEDSALELARLVASRPAFGVTAGLRRIAALSTQAQADDDAITLGRAATDPAVVAATRAYLESL
ncbi:enoyl-CoA hydratase/isomerase family protein [Nocardioides sp. QY071]|uniref:enoyl-CoA hydratase/isomerase family protein n=1 Tax=Nocardioides sp. QY071 TaxID=3044187 RepID=UPI00249B7BC6|nr:enoyl-CoA hydratase/isomerase family protein [Nocardioides sp. QY071]WGY01643.1 enoyl-CoA hydratase/isomerase family protein [Nocardioides sp. QY071]